MEELKLQLNIQGKVGLRELEKEEATQCTQNYELI